MGKRARHTLMFMEIDAFASGKDIVTAFTCIRMHPNAACMLTVLSSPNDDGTLHSGRAPEQVRALYQKFFVGGKSGRIGSTQPIDLLHEEREREMHRAGNGNSEKSSVGISATLDWGTGMRDLLFGEAGVEDRGIAPRTVPPTDDDEIRALKLLRDSNFSVATPGRPCQTMDKQALALEAEKFLEVGAAARSAYSDKIRDGSWEDATFPPRYPVTPKEKEEAEAAQVRKEREEIAAKTAKSVQKGERETVAKAAAAAERSARR